MLLNLTRVFLATAKDDIFIFLGETVDLLILLIGAALVGSTIFAGIQYISSGGDPEKAKKARTRLATNAAVLIMFILSARILLWILPG